MGTCDSLCTCDVLYVILFCVYIKFLSGFFFCKFDACVCVYASISFFDENKLFCQLALKVTY